jgi:parvulin-like peptidyl-prolyl isomerase
MGSIAQAESADLESRQEDGILPSEPRELFPAPIRDALQGKDTGALLEPIQVGNNWWIVRIEKKEEAPYTPSQRSQLAQQRLDRSVEDKKAALGAKIKRSFGADEIQWALDRLN